MREINKLQDNGVEVLETMVSKKRYTIKQLEQKLAYIDASIDKFKESRKYWQELYDEAKQITS